LIVQGGGSRRGVDLVGSDWKDRQKKNLRELWMEDLELKAGENEKAR
jgi:hypothetical protein